MPDGSVKFDTKLDSSGLDKGLKGLTKGLGAAFAAIGTGLTTAAGAAVKFGMEFEKQLSMVQAVTGMTAEEMKGVHDLALELGSAGAYSATEVANSMKYFAAAGLEAEEASRRMTETMGAVVDIATSAQLPLAQTAEIMSATMQSFGADAEEARHYADVLAAVTSVANTEVADLGEAFKYAAPIAAMYGYTLEETSVAMAAMANAGIQGSIAGTTLTRAMDDLHNVSPKVWKDLEKLGVQLPKVDFSAMSLGESMDWLRENVGKLDEEQQSLVVTTLFSTTAQKGMAAVIATAQEDWESYVVTINEAGEASMTLADGTELVGMAAIQAHIATDNLKGDVDKLLGTMKTLGILVYEEFSPSMREAVQSLRSLAMEAVSAAQDGGGLDGVIDALGGIVGGFLTLVVETLPKVMTATKKLFSTLGATLKKNIGIISKAAGEATATIVEAFIEILPDISEIGIGIVLGIAEGITSALPRLIPAATQMVVAISAALIKAIPKLLSVIPQIGRAIVEGFRNIDWGSLWVQLVEAFTEAWEGIKALWSDVTEPFKEINWAGVWESLKASALEAWEWIKASFLSVWEHIKNIDWSGVWAAIKTGFAAAGNFLKKLILGDNYTDMSTWADAGRSIWSAIKSAFIAVNDFLKKLILGDNYESDPSWANAGRTIWDAIKSGFAAASDFLKKLILGENYTETSTWAQAGATIWDAIKSGFVSVSEFLKKLILGDNYTDTSTWAQAGTEIWSAIKSGFIAVSEFLKKLILGDEYTDTSTWKQAGTTIWEAIKSGFAAVAGWLKDLLMGEDATWSAAGSEIWGLIKSGFDALGSIFKDTILEAKDIDTLISGLKVPDLDFSKLTEANKSVNSMVSHLETASENVNRILVRVAAGIELTEKESGQLQAEIEKLINSGIAAIQKETRTVNLTIDAVFGSGDTQGEALKADFATYMGGITEEAQRIGDEARKILIDAVGRSLTSEEAAQIAILKQSFEIEISKALSDLEAQARIQKLAFDNRSLAITKDDIKNLHDSIEEEVNQQVNALEFSLDTLEMQVRSMRIAQGVPESEINREIQELRDNVQAQIAAKQTEGLELFWSISRDSIFAPLEEGGFTSQEMQRYANEVLSILDTLPGDIRARAKEIGASGEEIPRELAWALEDVQILERIASLPDELLSPYETALGVKAKEIERAGYTSFSELYQAWGEVLGPGSPAAHAMALQMAEALGLLAPKVDEQKALLIELLSSLGYEAGEMMGLVLPKGIKVGMENGEIIVRDAANEIVDIAALAQQQAEINAKAAEAGEEVTDGVTTSMEEGAPDVATASDALVETGIITPLSGLPEETGAIAEDAAMAMETAILDAEEPIRAAATTVSDAAVQAYLLVMSVENGSEIGRAFTQAIIDAVLALQQMARGAAEQVANAAISGAQNTMTYYAGNSIGQNFGQGVVNGVMSMIGAAQAAGAALASAAVSAAAGAKGFDEHSPSKKGIEQGEFYGEGVAIGVEKSTTLAVEEARKLAEATNDELAAYLGGIDAEIDVSDILQRAQDALDREQLHIGAIADVVTNGSAYARGGGNAGDGITISISEISIHTEKLETDLDWREGGRLLGQEFARQARLKGVFRGW